MASPTDGQHTDENDTLDPFTVLATVPPAAQLLLRDYIAGLEAQAGAARARADRMAREFRADTDRLRGQVAEARLERDAAISALSAMRSPRALVGGVARRLAGR